MSTKRLSLFIVSTLVGITILISVLAGSDITNIFASSSDTNTNDSQQLNVKITQAREEIENELRNQGQIIINSISDQFGFDNVQSNLSLAYQSSSAGDAQPTLDQLETADSALEKSIVSLLRSGQELSSVSKNQSVVLDNNTRSIMNEFGQSISNLSTSADKIHSQISSD
jgi:cell division protein YceG involved in septum cleavage